MAQAPSPKLRGDPQVRALTALLDVDVDRRESRSRPGMRWVEAGTGGRVVLVPGAGEVCLDWAPVLPVLVGRHRVVAADRPGLGASRLTAKVTLRSQLDDLTGLLEEVGPAVVVGHSWGGLLAELVTLERPDLVGGLVLVDPFREGTSRTVPWRTRTASRVMLAGLVPLKVIGVFDRFATRMAQRLAEQATGDEETRTLLVRAYVSSYASVGQVAMIGRENRLGDSCDSDVATIRRRTTPPDLPMRLLTSSRGKPADLQRRYDALAESTVQAWPRGLHVAVPDAGHYIHHDRPDVVATAVADVSR